MRSKEAIVLAGGFGTRLAHLVPDVPKPMAPVAGHPFLEYILNNLDNSNFRKVVIADGYKKESIENYFGNSYRGLQIEYSREYSPLLTGGAVKKALELCTEEWVFVFNGDTYFAPDTDQIHKHASTLDTSTNAIVCAKEMRDFDRYGSLTINPSTNEILQFNEKTRCVRGYINAGVYCLRRECLEAEPDAFSLETDYFANRAVSGSIEAFISEGYFIDIGIPDDYELAQQTLKNQNKRWKLAIFDRDGTINVDTGHLFEPEKLELIPETVDLLAHYCDDPSYKVVVATNQAGIAKGLYDANAMNALHSALNKMLAPSGARVDAFYYCPHHPDFTGRCSCRKPKPGMLLKAIKEYNSEPGECVMYGDKETDELAAQAAGVRYVDVRTLLCRS